MCGYCEKINHFEKSCFQKNPKLRRYRGNGVLINLKSSRSSAYSEASKKSVPTAVGNVAMEKAETVEIEKSLCEKSNQVMEQKAQNEVPVDLSKEHFSKEGNDSATIGKDPEKNVVMNDDLGSEAKQREEHDTIYCSDNRLIREIQEQTDIQWFESGPTKEMIVSRGGLVLTKFLDRFRVLKKDHEDKLKGVNSGRKESEIEAVDDIRNAQKNVRSEDSLDKWPRRWNSRVGTESRKWEDFKAEWSDYVASEGLSGLNEFERKYTLLYALGCYYAQT